MKTVVMTGGTSGLGQVAAQQIFETPDTRLLLGARAKRETAIETWPLDLSRLASVRAFAQAMEETLAATQIDALVLIMGRIVRPLARLATIEQAGDALAALALGRVVPPPGRVYASLVRRRITWPDPSELAQRDDVIHLLWRESARMVALPEQP